MSACRKYVPLSRLHIRDDVCPECGASWDEGFREHIPERVVAGDVLDVAVCTNGHETGY